MKTRKLTFKRLTFEQVPATFHGLIKLHAPRPIHDEVGYKNTVEMVDALAGHRLNKDQEDYLVLLSILVERYEADMLPKRPRVTGLAMLRYNEAPVAASPKARRHARRAASVGSPKTERAPRTKAERLSELRKLVGPGRRISAVLRRANGRIVIYTEPDTSDIKGDRAKGTPIHHG